MPYYDQMKKGMTRRQHLEQTAREFDKDERRKEHGGNRTASGSYDPRHADPMPHASHRSRQTEAANHGLPHKEHALPRRAPEPREARRPEHEDRPLSEAVSQRPFERAPENLLSGRNPIREALKNGRDIEKLLVAKGELSGTAKEIVYMAKEAHIPVQVVERSRLDEITPHHQGLLAFASAYRYAEVEDMLEDARQKNEPPFLFVLDGVTDPQNLGAIIRTAACAGAHGVIVPTRRAVGLTPAAVKASAGAIEHIKVARVGNLVRTLDDLKKAGLWLFAADMDGENYLEADLRGPIALVIGSEGEGLSRLTRENCDHIISIPMTNAVDSLNASVAAGILGFAVRARRI